MVEQRSGEMVLYKPFWPSTAKDDNDAISPHKSKVKGANKANLFRIKIRTLGCALGISQEWDIVATPNQQPKSKTLLGTSKGLAWGVVDGA